MMFFRKRSKEASKNDPKSGSRAEGADYKISFQRLFYVSSFIILFFFILKILKALFIPIFIALIITFMIWPISHWTAKKLRLPIMLISGIVVLLFGFLFFVIGYVIWQRFLFFFQSLGDYERQLNTIINDIIGNLGKYSENKFWSSTLYRFQNLEEFDISGYILSTLNKDFYLSGANTFLQFFSSLFLIFIFVFFMISEFQSLVKKIHFSFPIETASSVIVQLNQISGKISHYLQIKTVISLITGALIWILLFCFQMENAIMWASFAFILNFIPTIGSILITFALSLVALIELYPNWNLILLVLLFAVLIQVLMGNIIDPQLQGDRLDLSPLVILISLAFWGWLWGITGMFLAVPLLELVRITCNGIRELRPIAIFISSGKYFPQVKKEIEQDSPPDPEPQAHH